MRQHPEAISAATTKGGQWALIVRPFVGNVSFVIASCRDISADIDQVGNNIDDLGLCLPPGPPGFYLFEGAVSFDGLDDVVYEGSFRVVGKRELLKVISRHESWPPEEAVA